MRCTEQVRLRTDAVEWLGIRNQLPLPQQLSRRKQMVSQGAEGDLIHRSNPRHALMAFDSEKILRFDLLQVRFQPICELNLELRRPGLRENDRRQQVQ